MSERSESRLRNVLESMSEGYITFDRAWRVQYVNPRGELMLGRPAAELIGLDIWDAFPQARSVAALGRLRDAMERRVAVEFDDEYTPAGRWFEVRAYPTDEGMAVFFRDVTASRKARHFTELSHRLLAETGAALATKLDVRELLASFVKVVVPSFADALVLTLHEDDDTLVRLEPYADPPDRDLTSALPAGVETDAMLREVAFAGEPLRLASSTPADSGFAAIVRGLGYRDVVIVPLTATGRTRGALALLAREPGRYGESELRLAIELAQRAGFAIDNVRLYESALLANQAKSDFLAVMSHELRTPLTTVMGYTDLMLSGLPEPLPETAQRYAQRVRMAAWHLLAIIEQILVYTRLEVGTEAPHPERVSGMDVLQDAAGLIEPVAREKGVEFVLHPPAEPIVIETDATKLRQILLNLLSNAIRFTDHGSVSITAVTSGPDVLFHVQDTGIGIEPDYLQRIFEPFWQVDQSATRRVGGTGLGLSVSRRLARLLGGDIEVESTLGEGTTCTVRLPRRWSEG